jgi:tRNA (adenine37-N6)-methyltransferase
MTKAKNKKTTTRPSARKNKAGKSFPLKPIGEIRTPYGPDNCPRFADEKSRDEARIVVSPRYRNGLKDLEAFNYIYVLFYLDRPHKPASLTAHPPSLKGKEVGVFASRSPSRPNPVGLSIVRLKRIEDGTLVTSAIDAYDRTPLLDIKPFFRDDDLRQKANNGWQKTVTA